MRGGVTPHKARKPYLLRRPRRVCGVLWVGIPLPVVWGLVGGNSPPSFPPLWCGVGWVGIPLPPSRPVVWGLVGGNPPPCGVGSGGWESPSLPPMVWGLVGSSLCWAVLVGSNPWSFQSGASLARQAIFCGRRFCSETIQHRAIKSVLMTSRPPIIDYTLCRPLLYTIYSRVYTIYYRLYSVYRVYLYTIARPLKGGNQVLHTSLRAMWEPDYSIQHTIVQYLTLQYTIVYYSIL